MVVCKMMNLSYRHFYLQILFAEIRIKIWRRGKNHFPRLSSFKVESNHCWNSVPNLWIRKCMLHFVEENIAVMPMQHLAFKFGLEVIDYFLLNSSPRIFKLVKDVLGLLENALPLQYVWLQCGFSSIWKLWLSFNSKVHREACLYEHCYI